MNGNWWQSIQRWNLNGHRGKYQEARFKIGGIWCHRSNHKDTEVTGEWVTIEEVGFQIHFHHPSPYSPLWLQQETEIYSLEKVHKRASVCRNKWLYWTYRPHWAEQQGDHLRKCDRPDGKVNTQLSSLFLVPSSGSRPHSQAELFTGETGWLKREDWHLWNSSQNKWTWLHQPTWSEPVDQNLLPTDSFQWAF